MNDLIPNLLRMLDPENAKALVALADIQDMKPKSSAQKQNVAITNALRSLEDQITFLLHDRLRLQKIVDKDADHRIELLYLTITDSFNAWAAPKVFGSEWFANQPYSDSALKKIAQVLLDLTTPFLGYENKFWKDVVKGDFLGLAMHQEKETPKKPARLRNIFSHEST